MEVEIKMEEKEIFIEQEKKFLKELLEKYRIENPKEEINLEEEIKPGDLLLFKASNSLSLSKVIQEIRSKHCLPK